MNRIAVIAGGILFNTGLLDGATPQTLRTEYGVSILFLKEDLVFLPRHGKMNNIPPHRINHLTNIASLQRLGVKSIIGINSVGSLKEEITPEYLLVPDDYIDLWNIKTFYNEGLVHITPALSCGLRQCIIAALARLKIPYKDKGVYIQTMGPRLETRAEIRMLKNFGDVVGMTMASEATAARELGLDYASLCSIDNFCHGIGPSSLSEEEIKENARKKAETIKRVLMEIIERLR